MIFDIFTNRLNAKLYTVYCYFSFTNVVVAQITTRAGCTQWNMGTSDQDNSINCLSGIADTIASEQCAIYNRVSYAIVADIYPSMGNTHVDSYYRYSENITENSLLPNINASISQMKSETTDLLSILFSITNI